MTRRKIPEADKQRAKLLGLALTRRKVDRDLSIQDLSSESQVAYQTVRALLQGKSAGPSFFLVADVAAALEVQLDALAIEAKEDPDGDS